MLQRGRKGRLRFTLMQSEGKLPAPPHFSEEERKFWDEIVSSLGSSYFPVETRPILEQFVTVSIATRRRDLSTKDRLSFSLCLCKLATSLRISQYASLKKLKPKPAYIKPLWETKD